MSPPQISGSHGEWDPGSEPANPGNRFAADPGFAPVDDVGHRQDQMHTPEPHSDGVDTRHDPQLNDELRNEILSTEKGSRPDPLDYLSSEYIREHLEMFDDGASRFMTAENLRDYGIGQRDGNTFVFPTRELDALMGATGGDRRALEQTLGLPEGYFDAYSVVRVDIPDPRHYDLRIPSGNEAGANDQWIPGGLLPEGMPEAVIRGSDVPPDDYFVTDLPD